MENRKDIGKIFREKINYLDKEPNNDGWNAIQSELDKKKKKRLIFIPFWFKTIGLLTAGSLCLWLITNHTFENETFFERDAKSSNTKSNDTSTNDKNNSPITSQNNAKYREATTSITTATVATDTALNSKRTGIYKKTGKHNSNNATLASLLTDSKNSTTYKRNRSANNEKTKPITKSNDSQNKKSKKKFRKTKINNQNSEKPIKNTKAENPDNPTNNTLPMATVTVAENSELDKNKSVKNNKKVILKAIEKDTINNPEIKEKSFELFVYGSPTLSGLSKNKSLLDNRLNNNTTTSNVTFSYGAYFCYQGTANFSLRIGLGMINLNLITLDVPVNTVNYSNINYSKGMSNAYIYSQSNNSEYMKINQEISYIEIPLEAKYRLIHHKFGINAIMGINYLYLNNNEVTALTADGSKFKIGNTANLMDRTLGLNFGMGFEYSLSKKIKFNVEPIFKYHFKNSQNDNESKLLSINVLTGLQIKFGK